MRRIERVFMQYFVIILSWGFTLFSEATAMHLSDQSFSGQSHRISMISTRRLLSERFSGRKIRDAIRSLFSRPSNENTQASARPISSRLSRIFLGTQSLSSKSPDDRLPFLLIKVYCDPPVEIWKLPTEERLILNGCVISQSLYIPGGLVCGDTTVKVPLFLRSDMDNKLFVNQIFRAFDFRTCKYITGTVRRRRLEESFIEFR